MNLLNKLDRKRKLEDNEDSDFEGLGVNSRWGSIISISFLDWGSIRIFVGWGSNQDCGSIRADTVVSIGTSFSNFVPFLPYFTYSLT